MEHYQLLGEVISAGGGRLIGRVRLQKIFYLLDQLGLGSGFSYSYHHYGPYSSELSEAVADASAFDVINERVDHRPSDGVSYSVYTLGDSFSGGGSSQLGTLEKQRAAQVIQRLQQQSATVLEIAATIHWLKNVERVQNWQAELKRRKGIKAERGRTGQAENLLRSIGL